jgi:hypothetical protein
MSFVHLAGHGGLRRKVALNDLGVSSIAWRSRTAATTTSRRSPAIPTEPARRRVVHEPVRRGLPQPERRRARAPTNDGTAKSSRRLARPSNEPEADPLLGGFFIGDYIEVFAHDRTAWVGYNANDRSRAAAVRGSPDPAEGQTLWPRCGCSCSLARSEDGAPLDQGLHPSLAADGVNARGGLRQPEGAGRYGVSRHLPPHRLGSDAPRRGTDPPPELTRSALVFLGTPTARLVADGQVVARSAPVGS